MKTHFKKIGNKKFLGSWDLINDDGTYREVNEKVIKVKTDIAHDGRGGESEVAVAVLQNLKPMILNSGNKKIMAKLTGSKFIEDWNHVNVVIKVKTVKAFGEFIDSLRLEKPKVNQTQKPELTPNHKAWDKAKEAIANGQASLEAVEKKYIINPENKALLCSK